MSAASCPDCVDLARRLQLLADHLGVNLDVLDARATFEDANGDVDADTWLTAMADARRSSLTPARDNLLRMTPARDRFLRLQGVA